MFGNYFKTATRNLNKNKLYSGINILGLTAGITAFLLIAVYLRHELSYDRFNLNADRIVRLTMEYKQSGTVNTTASTGTKPGPEFKRQFPLVEDYVRTYAGGAVVKKGNLMFDESRMLYADSGFFKTFSFPIIAGDASSPLDAPDKIVITRSMARKYFGGQDPVNQTIVVKDQIMRVSAVCADAPDNSQIKFDFVQPFLNLGAAKTNTWWTANWITYLRLRDGGDVSKLRTRITNYMQQPDVRADAGATGGDYLTYHVEPLTRVHLYSGLDGFEPGGSIVYIYMLGIIAVIILFIASANYTNLATAQSASRGSEIGMRKVMGASGKQIFFQFIGESAFLVIIAGILALGLSIVLLPAFNRVTGLHLTSAVLYQPVILTGLLATIALVSFLAGLYPAVILSNTQVMSVLKKSFTFTGGSNLLRRGLIVLQFGISVFLIIFTVITLQQMQYLHSKDLGYNKDHLLVLPVPRNNPERFQTLKDALGHIRGVEGVTATYKTPEHVEWSDGIETIDEKGKHSVSVNAMPVDLDFTGTLQLPLLAGRDFQSSDFAGIDTTDGGSHAKNIFLINETLARVIGWTPQQALGKTIDKGAPGRVVGVVKDFNFTSLHEAIGPMVIFLSRDFAHDFMIRIDGNDMAATIARLEEVWKTRVADQPFNYHFLDDSYNRLYLSEERTSRVFAVAAALAIILACLGLFGLAAFTTLQRTKEIGIRRVLGASLGGITMLIAGNFLRLVLISIAIAIPLGWWAGSQWLQGFAFRIPVHASVFVSTASATILIVLLTVGYHSVKAGLSNPVKSLRAD